MSGSRNFPRRASLLISLMGFEEAIFITSIMKDIDGYQSALEPIEKYCTNSRPTTYTARKPYDTRPQTNQYRHSR